MEQMTRKIWEFVEDKTLLNKEARMAATSKAHGIYNPEGSIDKADNRSESLELETQGLVWNHAQ